MREHHCALYLSDTDEGLIDSIVCTADWGYRRLRREEYPDKMIGELAGKIRSQDWKSVYVFFKDEGEGRGPKYAQRFRELAKA